MLETEARTIVGRAEREPGATFPRHCVVHEPSCELVRIHRVPPPSQPEGLALGVHPGPVAVVTARIRDS